MYEDTQEICVEVNSVKNKNKICQNNTHNSDNSPEKIEKNPAASSLTSISNTESSKSEKTEVLLGNYSLKEDLNNISNVIPVHIFRGEDRRYPLDIAVKINPNSCNERLDFLMDPKENSVKVTEEIIGTETVECIKDTDIESNKQLLESLDYNLSKSIPNVNIENIDKKEDLYYGLTKVNHGQCCINKSGDDSEGCSRIGTGIALESNITNISNISSIIKLENTIVENNIPSESHAEITFEKLNNDKNISDEFKNNVPCNYVFHEQPNHRPKTVDCNDVSQIGTGSNSALGTDSDILLIKNDDLIQRNKTLQKDTQKLSQFTVNVEENNEFQETTTSITSASNKTGLENIITKNSLIVEPIVNLNDAVTFNSKVLSNDTIQEGNDIPNNTQIVKNVEKCISKTSDFIDSNESICKDIITIESHDNVTLNKEFKQEQDNSVMVASNAFNNSIQGNPQLTMTSLESNILSEANVSGALNLNNSELNSTSAGHKKSNGSLSNDSIHQDKNISLTDSQESQELNDKSSDDVSIHTNLGDFMCTDNEKYKVIMDEVDEELSNCTEETMQVVLNEAGVIDRQSDCIFANNVLDTTINLNIDTILVENNSLPHNSKNTEIEKDTLQGKENIIDKECINELNKEHILSEFQINKQKVTATQKVLPDISQTIDIKSRIPKEILSHDLGSIVKNVHGIFSSMSGSLKNAYNNTQRVQKPVKNLTQPNSKVLNDIFEEADERLVETKIERDLSLNVETNIEVEVPIDNDLGKDFSKLQIESLERVLAEQRRENASLRDKIKMQVEELQAKNVAFKELEVKVEQMCKYTEQAQREKDAAVMKYASLECSVIEAKKAAENSMKAERAAIAEQELMVNKLKTARDEKQRICQLYDDKCHELANSEREVSKLKEDVREIEGRLKWTQNKLRVEMDAFKESADRADKLTQRLSELESAKDSAVVNASGKAKQLELELKEKEAALILCKHENEDLERRFAVTSQQLDAAKRELEETCGNLARTQAELERVREHASRVEEEAAELAALRAQAALADTLSSQLQRETERASQAEEALSKERARAETCARREANALEHAARLTALHVASRHAAHAHEDTAKALAVDNASLRERITTLEGELKKLQTDLEEEKERRNKETRVLARKVAELTEEASEANKKLEWEKGEVAVLKKRHASAVKELNRELQRALKRVEQLESKIPGSSEATSTRTGSVTSLSSGGDPPEDRLNGHSQPEPLPDIQIKEPSLIDKIFAKREPDKQTLIERIVHLQRTLARRAERCEFLEEHVRQLTGELRVKSKLLRNMLAASPAGALATPTSDRNKKEIARLGGGAMAAVWGGDPGGMSLELSLEMNKKLQAVLEDTLLKNITLKENIDTLGEEIARLKGKPRENNS
ncbi:myosin-9 isoform X2 [Leptidea sinapis]|uniref:myosin-9 isoform X2 n=1 Tax=Leptidea sinapis TaxID=189913 RepID=UPI0021C2ED73|nr:myosin-9 isoform X2 [Leptidea sinapis]